MKVKFKKLDANAVIPSYAKSGDAGLDLTAISINEAPEYYEYGTGLAVEIPKGYVGLIFPRSSVSKVDLVQANSVGVVDSGYRGEIKIRFKRVKHQDSNISRRFGLERVAQLIIMKYPVIEVEEAEELSETERGEGGFGHTGK